MIGTISIVALLCGITVWIVLELRDIKRIQRATRENRAIFDRLFNPLLVYLDYIQDGQVTKDGFQQFLIRNYGEAQTQAYLQELHERAEQVRLKKEVS